MDLELFWTGDVHGPHRGSLLALADPAFADPPKPASGLPRGVANPGPKRSQIGELRVRVLEALQMASQTVEELATALGVSELQVHNAVYPMRARGWVRAVERIKKPGSYGASRRRYGITLDGRAVLAGRSTHKACVVCAQRKPVDCFGRDRGTPDGYDTCCRMCRHVKDRRKRAGDGYDSAA